MDEDYVTEEPYVMPPPCFDPEPPEDQAWPDGCYCYEWRQYPKGQEHFGYTWWLSCNYMHRLSTRPRCECECHVGQIWRG